MGSSVSLKCTLNRVYVPAGKKSIVYLAMDIFPAENTSVHESLPSAICLLIDRSGSMWGKKLNQAKAAAKGLINQLQPGDAIGLVTFSSKIEVIAEMEQLQFFDITDLKKKVDKIRCGGGTELYHGLDNAYLQFIRTGRTEANLVKRVILLSDGQPTDHIPDSHFLKLADEMGRTGISIMALGIGKEYNENLLSDIAELSHGIWKHIADAEDMPAIFTEQLEETRAVVRISPVVNMQLDPEVEIKNMYKAAPEIYPINDQKPSASGEIILKPGDIRSGESQMLVARLSIPARPEGTYKLGRVQIVDEESTAQDVMIVYTADEKLWSMENDAFARGSFLKAETQTMARKGLSGDATALWQAEQQAETMVRDPNLSKIGTMKDDMSRVADLVRKSKQGLTEEETKAAKHDMTRAYRR